MFQLWITLDLPPIGSHGSGGSCGKSLRIDPLLQRVAELFPLDGVGQCSEHRLELRDRRWEVLEHASRAYLLLQYPFFFTYKIKTGNMDML